MATGAHGGQAVGVAAALCRKWNCLPADGEWWSAEEYPLAQLLPLPAGRTPKITLTLSLAEEAEITFALRGASRPDHHTPDVLLAEQTLRLPAGEAVEAALDFGVTLDEARVVFVCLPKHPGLAVRCSRGIVTGLMALHNYRDEKTSHVGGEDFAIYSPRRRPADQNFALRIEPPLDVFGPANVVNGVDRPTHQPNVWLADPADPAPRLTLEWPAPQTLRRIDLAFDTDFDHALESVLMEQPERAMPFCVKRYRILDGDGKILHECAANHISHHSVRFSDPVTTATLHIELLEMQRPGVPPALFGLHCHAGE